MVKNSWQFGFSYWSLTWPKELLWFSYCCFYCQRLWGNSAANLWPWRVGNVMAEFWKYTIWRTWQVDFEWQSMATDFHMVHKPVIMEMAAFETKKKILTMTMKPNTWSNYPSATKSYAAPHIHCSSLYCSLFCHSILFKSVKKFLLFCLLLSSAFNFYFFPLTVFYLFLLLCWTYSYSKSFQYTFVHAFYFYYSCHKPHHH